MSADIMLPRDKTEVVKTIKLGVFMLWFVVDTLPFERAGMPISAEIAWEYLLLYFAGMLVKVP